MGVACFGVGTIGAQNGGPLLGREAETNQCRGANSYFGSTHLIRLLVVGLMGTGVWSPEG